MGKNRMTEWLTGEEVMNRWGLRPFELLEILNKGLTPYKQETLSSYITDSEWEEELAPKLGGPLDFEHHRIRDYSEIYDDLDRCLFVRKQIESFEKEYGLKAGNKNPERSHTSEKVFPCEPGTKWEDVKITLKADDMVRIKTPQGEGIFTYHELEMAHKQSKRTTMLWGLLKLFAENQGFISRKNVTYDPKLPDTAKRLNKHFKKLFIIDDSIYQGHYKAERGYKTKIQFSDARSVQKTSPNEESPANEIDEIFDEAESKIDDHLKLP